MMLPRRALGVLALAFFGSSVNAAASPISVTYIDPVTNWEWAEVAELKGLTWHQVNGICAEDGVTACAGTLAGRNSTAGYGRLPIRYEISSCIPPRD